MESVLQYIESMAKDEWESLHSANFVVRFGKWLRLVRVPRVIWIRQYEDGDWNTSVCLGDACRVWKYDSEGMVAVEEIDSVDSSGLVSTTTPIISFCVSGNRAILTTWRGKRSSGGDMLKYENDEWKWDSNGTSWWSYLLKSKCEQETGPTVS